MEQKTHLIFDAWGVIFLQEDDVKEVLIPFLRAQFPQLNTDLLKDLYYHQVSVGKISSEQFFTQLGLPNLSSVYLDECVQIDPAFYRTAKTLKEKYELVMCSNDVSEWSQFLRDKFHLDTFFSHVYISGDVGFRKPDSQIYRILLKELKISSNQCIMIDNTLSNLETAAQIGMTTIHFKRSMSPSSFTPDFTVLTFHDLEKILFT